MTSSTPGTASTAGPSRAAGTPSATAMAAATPVDRDRYVDLLRAGSLATVVLGHWLMIAPMPGPAGTTRVTNLLAVVPGLQPMTWLLQVMPVFFLVGGFSHATALTSARRATPMAYAEFVRMRAGRLLRPTAVFVAVWIVFSLFVAAAGADAGLPRVALRTVAQPLWFLGVYLAVVALAPPMWRLHRLAGRRAAAVPMALFAAAGVVDVLRFAGGVPHVGYLNVAFVWVGVHQLGFLYADGTLRRGGRRLGLLLAGGGLASVVAMTALGPYPVSMVGVPGDAVSNMSPPTAALAAHAVWLTGLVLLLRPPSTRWLARARVWRVVVLGNMVAMTAFLWHLTAAFAAIAGTEALGLSGPPAGSMIWWLFRPAWLVALALITAALVVIFRRFEAPRPRSGRGPGAPVVQDGPAVRPGWHPLLAGSGMAACTIGVLGLSAVGFGGLLEGRTAMVVVVPVGVPGAVALLAAGAALLAGSGAHRPGRVGGTAS